MEDKEFYIFGKNIKTDLCEIRFLKYHEYIEHMSDLSMMSLNVLHIYYQYKKTNVDNIKRNDELEEFKKKSLYEIVLKQPQFTIAYYEVFKLVIDNVDAIEAIFDDEKLFMAYRQLVMNMNFLTETEVSPNPEIQKGIERSLRVKQAKSEKQTFSDITSSIVVEAGMDYETVGNMTVLQLYSTYYRISQMKAYTTTVLYSTVTEKVSIESWGKHIDLFPSGSNTTIEKNQFDKQFGGLFS